MQNLITRAYARWSAAGRQRAESERLAGMPHYLLRDMGLPLDGPAAISRQIAGDVMRARGRSRR